MRLFLDRLTLIGAAAALALPFTVAAAPAVPSPRAPASAPSGPPGPKFFVVGAYAQGVSAMDTWVKRGINTYFSPTDDFAGDHGDTWRTTAAAKGLKMVVGGRHQFDGGLPSGATYSTTASNSYALNQSDPNVIANFGYDEPDIVGPQRSAHDTEVAFARSLGNTKGFFFNFTGNIPGWQYTSLGPQNFVNWASASWQSLDQYPYQGGVAYAYHDVDAQDGFQGNFTTMNGRAVGAMYFGPINGFALTAPYKPVFAFLSTSRVTSTAPGPYARLTATQYRVQAWSSIINGASGLIHFSHFDAGKPDMVTDDTNAELSGAIGDLVAKLAVLQNQGGQNLLMDVTNGGRRSFIRRRSAKQVGGGGWKWPADQPTFVAPIGLELPAWFEGDEIPVNGETYLLVLNLDDINGHTLTDQRWHVSGMSFAPGQVRLLKASNPAGDLFMSPDDKPPRRPLPAR
ncbi:MAG: hypothetical protein JSR98_19510 [Proteobacteria bacterium]|nr:hypothetical protein [Pseudomonadota bacterium]